MIRFAAMSQAWFVAGILTFCTFVVVGCTPAKRTGAVSGKVTYKGEPVAEGEITLYMAEKGAGATVKLESGGQFKVATPLEVGTYVVSVLPPVPEPSLSGPTKVKQYPNIPNKVRDSATSGIKVEIQEGVNELAVDLGK